MEELKRKSSGEKNGNEAKNLAYEYTCEDDSISTSINHNGENDRISACVNHDGEDDIISTLINHSGEDDRMSACVNHGGEDDSISACIDQMRVEMDNKKKNKKPLRSLISFDGSCRTKIARYLSTGAYEELEVDSDNFEQYLYIAKELNHVDLRNYCENELMKQITPEVSLEMLQVASGYGLHKLNERSVSLIADNFSTIWNTPDFQYLGKNEVITLLKNKKIKSHHDVFSAIKHWLKYEPEFRLDAYNVMCQHLNIADSPGSETRPIQGICSSFQKYVVMFTYDESQKFPKVVTMGVKNFKSMSKVIQKMGHLGPELAVCCQQEDGTSAPYVVVAVSNGKNSTRVFKFDVILSKWKEIQNVKDARLENCLVAVKDNLYILGGYSLTKGRNVTLVEECKSGKMWKGVGHLEQSVKSPACVTYKDSIYVFGGKLNSGGKSTAIQCYNVTTHNAHIVSQLTSPASGGEAVILNEKIYVLTEQGALFIFDPVSNTCIEGDTHKHALTDFAMFTDGTNVYTAGGVCGKTESTADIYRYSVKSNIWQKMGHSLPFPVQVYGHCTVIIQQDFAMVPFID